MRAYRDAAAFRSAVEARLRPSGEDTQRLNRRVVVERLLARILAVDESVCILLKGGSALEARLGSRARTTKDVDFEADDADRARDILERAVVHDLGDYFAFRIERYEGLHVDAATPVHRYSITCELAGRPFGPSRLKVEIGMSTGPSGYERVRTAGLLEFAGITAVEYPALPIEDHYAEKLHGATKAWNGRENTRAKDLFDMMLLQEEFDLNSDRVRAAIARTFDARATHTVPDRLPDFDSALWEAAIRRFGREHDRDLSLEEVRQVVAFYVDPILQDLSRGKAGD